MLAPTNHRFSVRECYRMAEKGVWCADARVELVLVGYGSKRVLRAGDTAQALAFPDLLVDVAALLKR